MLEVHECVEVGRDVDAIARIATGEHDDGRRFAVRLRHAAEGVLRARAVLHREDADLLTRGDAADRVGHVQTSALLANDDGADVSPRGRLDDRVDGVADQKLDTFASQDLGNGIGSFHARPAYPAASGTRSPPRSGLDDPLNPCERLRSCGVGGGLDDDRVAHPQGATRQDACAQTAAVDQRLKDRFAHQLFEMVAGWAVFHAFEEYRADAESLSDQPEQVDAADGDVAAVLHGAQMYAVFGDELVQGLRLEQGDLARAGVGGPAGVEAGLAVVAITGQSAAGDGFDFGERLHGYAGRGCDTDRFDTSHDRQRTNRAVI